MTVLTDPERQQVVAQFMRTIECPGGITKPQLRAVVDSIDDWWETVAADGNNSIPQPQRGIMTTKQKSALFTAVLAKRYEVT